MKKIKKYIPAILYCTLLLIAVSLCIYIAETTDFVAEATENGEIAYSPEDTENTSSVEIFPEKKEDPFEPTTTEKPIQQEFEPYSDVVPRNASSSEEYAYKQKIYGDGSVELCDVIQTSVGIYIIAKTDNKKGDIFGTDPCVGVAKIDAFGNLISTLSLDPAYANKYVTAGPTSLGLVIITLSKDAKYFYIYILSYDLTASTPYRIPAGKSGAIHATQNSFLLFSEYENESLVYSFTNGSFSFQSIPRGKVIQLFEYGTYYILFTSFERDNTYTVSRISKDTLSILQETTYSSTLLQYVFPIFRDAKQQFITLENRNGVIWARIFLDQTFNETTEIKKIGTFSLQRAFYDGENILLVCNGNINGIIILHSDLSTQFPNTTTDYIPLTIEECIYYEQNFYILSRSDTDDLALITTKNDSVSYEYFHVKTKKGTIIQNLDKSFTLVYQSDSQIEILGLNKK